MAAMNVLVIDRDKTVQNLLKEELESGGYKVWVTSELRRSPLALY
jgi:CheY-like chemotaxis protein